MAPGESLTTEEEVELVARALMQRGARREAVSLLRGVVARDRHTESCQILLAAVLVGEEIPGPARTVPLDLALVDRWIRGGMLVEALSLLGGTSLGSDDTGHEWANLLGELLAPAPAGSSEDLREVYRHLLTGGASLALTLLEERARRGERVPNWALRRLALLRWMLLDNARGSDPGPGLTADSSSALSHALVGPMQARDLGKTLAAARDHLSIVPEDGDTIRAVAALANLVQVIEHAQAHQDPQLKTIPMVGHPAAILQIQMGNLAQAAALYDRLLEQHPGDDRARFLVGEIRVVLAALAGDPLPTEGLDDDPVEATLGEERGLTISGPDGVDEDATASLELSLEASQGITQNETDTEPPPVRQEARAPDSTPEPAAFPGHDDITVVPGGGARPAGQGDGEAAMRPVLADSTKPMQTAHAQAEALLAAGHLAEAEALYRGVAQLGPENAWCLTRAEEIRARQGETAWEGVVIRRIERVG